MTRSVSRVVVVQALAQPMRFDAHDGVFLLVEGCGAPQRFYRDVVLFDLVRLALEVPIANISKEAFLVGGPMKNARSQHGFDFRAFRLRLG
jgi:hypothetical protein